MIAYKSFEIDEELENAKKAIKEFGGKVEEVVELVLPQTDIKRKLVIISKQSPTPNKYPRGLNKPKLMPIE